MPAWSPWQEGCKEVLEKVQKRAVKMISGLEGKTYEERLKEVGLLTLEERRHQADMVQAYKIVTGKDIRAGHKETLLTKSGGELEQYSFQPEAGRNSESLQKWLQRL